MVAYNSSAKEEEKAGDMRVALRFLISESCVCDLCEVRYGKPLKTLTVEVTRLHRDGMSLMDY